MDAFPAQWIMLDSRWFPGPETMNNETPFADMTHDEQRAYLLGMSREDVIDVLLITADRVNELERAMIKLGDFVLDTLRRADIDL